VNNGATNGDKRRKVKLKALSTGKKTLPFQDPFETKSFGAMVSSPFDMPSSDPNTPFGQAPPEGPAAGSTPAATSASPFGAAVPVPVPATPFGAAAPPAAAKPASPFGAAAPAAAASASPFGRASGPQGLTLVHFSGLTLRAVVWDELDGVSVTKLHKTGISG
jgi:hypothetical protein